MVQLLRFALVCSISLVFGNPSSVRLRTRKLQDDSACAVPFEDATIYTPDVGDVLKPSYVEACLSSLYVNETLVMEHIQSVKETFRQYYCFYDIVNDPANSDPLGFQEELGYTLFSGPLEGQVNLEEEFNALLSSVEAEGASLATFWDLRTIVNKLYDAHVNLAPLAGIVGELATVHGLYVYPARNLQNDTSNVVLAMTPSYSDDGELELTITFQDTDGSEITESIVEINGMTPYDWYYDLVSKPETAVMWPYQAIGSRMNRAFVYTNTVGQLDAFRLTTLSRPTATLPDSFSVTYASGEEEMYYTTLQYGGALDASAVYDLVNNMPPIDTPGSAFINFRDLALTTANVTAIANNTAVAKAVKPSTRKVVFELLPEKPRPRSAHDDNHGTTFEFDETIVLPNIFSNELQEMAAFSIEDDYAVLKVQSWAMQPSDVIAIWSNFTAAARAKGVKKAIIDVSFNGGAGNVSAADALSISMYPFVPYEYFSDQWDSDYNNVMLVTNQTIFPLVRNIGANLEAFTNAELQGYLDTLPADIDQRLSALVASMSSFCCDANLTSCADTKCQPLLTLDQSIATLSQFRTGPQLRSVLQELIKSFFVLNAFNTANGLERLRVDPDYIIEVIRGGQAQNLTNRFELLSEPQYYRIVARAFQLNFMFDEYVILSDGTAGSASAIFTTKVQQLWNNRDIRWNGRDVPPIPLTTVTYGGTKNPSDTTMAGYPARNQNVNIGVPIITSGLMYLLEFLAPPSLAPQIRVVNEEVYQATLPIPPYFAEGLTDLPVSNYYSKFMEPGAIPLQYVKISSDRHIQKIFRGNTLADPSDLGALYSATAAELGFSAVSTDMPEIEVPTTDVPEETTVPSEVTESPTKEETESPTEDESEMPMATDSPSAAATVSATTPQVEEEGNSTVGTVPLKVEEESFDDLKIWT